MTFDIMGDINRFTSDMQKERIRMAKEVTESNRRAIEREEEKIQLLRDIKQSLPEIVTLIRNNNEINKELFDLFQELNNILLAKNEAEAKGILAKVLEKASFVNNGIGTVTSLASYGEMLLHFINMK